MKKILLIEDDVDLFSLLKYNLEKEGFSLSGLQTGKGAIELPNASSGTGAPFSTMIHRRAASSISTSTTPTIKITISVVSRYPVNICPGFNRSGQKMFRIDSTPADERRHAHKAHRKKRDPRVARLPHVDQERGETASAMVASNWLPVPNSGQIVEMLPV
jgi:hypothetical protein